MSSQKVTVLVSFKAKSGSEDQLYEQLCALANEALKDPGCLLFECKKNRDEKGLFLFHEEWASQVDLDNHQKMPYLPICREKRAPFLDGDRKVSVWLSQDTV